MSDHFAEYCLQQLDLFESEKSRSLLDQLLADSRLYTESKDYKDLLDFVVKLRNFAPFNAMLLQVQKPGLSYAATYRDWHDRFGRKPKEGARPLLILMPFAPVALVYDVVDTEGKPPLNPTFKVSEIVCPPHIFILIIAELLRIRFYGVVCFIVRWFRTGCFG